MEFLRINDHYINIDRIAYYVAYRAPDNVFCVDIHFVSVPGDVSARLHLESSQAYRFIQWIAATDSVRILNLGEMKES